MTTTVRKVILVTAGAKGIGRAICEKFAAAGDKVYFADIDTGAGNELEKELSGAVFIKCDIADGTSIKKAVEQVVATEKHIDVLVNNAGIGVTTDFLSDDAIAAFDQAVNVTLRGTFLFSHYAAQHMKDGAIINISSTRALQSEANTEGYTASKGGVLSLTHAMSISLASRHIRVNAVLPGWIDVQHYQSSAATRQPSAHAKPYQLTQKDHEQHPVGRVGIPADIANLVYFLADNTTAGFITGQNFVVDGGMTKKMIYV